MTDKERESQLSAMFDGELPSAECELLARRLARDTQMQRSWATYSLIGTVLRSEPLARGSFAAEVSRRVVRDEGAAARARADAAADSRRAASAGSRASSWWVPFSGLGVAAGVATLAIFFSRIPSEQELVANRLAQVSAAEVVLSAAAPALPSMSGTTASVVADSAQETLAAAGETAAGSEPESYVTPLPTPLSAEGRGSSAGIAASLANYVVAHSSVSAPLLRHSTLSAFVTAEVPEPVVPNDSDDARARSAAGTSAGSGAEAR